MRFSEAIKKYNEFKSLEREVATIRGYDLDLRQLCLWLRNPMIIQVTIDQVVEYVNGMKELGWNQNSIMVKCVAYTGFFKFWKKKGYPVLDYELIPHVKRKYVQAKIGDVDDLKKLFEACSGNEPLNIRNKALLMILVDTGARIGEIGSLNDDIDTTTNDEGMYGTIIRTEKSRGQKPVRRIYWYSKTNDALKEWIACKKNLGKLEDPNALFVSLGMRRFGSRMQSDKAGQIIGRLSKRAGLAYTYNCHSLRHRFGNDLASNGANNSTISDLMGHASLSSSFVYTHLNDKQAKDAHRKYRNDIA